MAAHFLTLPLHFPRILHSTGCCSVITVLTRCRCLFWVLVAFVLSVSLTYRVELYILSRHHSFCCSAFILLTDKMFSTFSAHCLAPTAQDGYSVAVCTCIFTIAKHKAVANFSIVSSLQKIGTIEILTSSPPTVRYTVRYVC
jgi:hypothetical protein